MASEYINRKLLTLSWNQVEVRFVRIDSDLCVDRAYRSSVTLLHLIKQSVLTVLLLLFNDNYLLYLYYICV